MMFMFTYLLKYNTVKKLISKAKQQQNVSQKPTQSTDIEYKVTKAWSISSSVGFRRPRFGPDLVTRSSLR